MNAQILIRSGVDLKTFREEILPANDPVLLRGLVSHWPAVHAALESPDALGSYLSGLDQQKPVAVLEGPPSIQGRFFYSEDMRGLNFERRPATISATIARLLAQRDTTDAPSLYIESTPTSEHLPAFAAANANPLLPPTLVPRLWVGNQLTVQTHFDLSSNIACVVGGRRRFTLFPPDQLPNLYVGPIDFTVSGPPLSLVPLHAPDPQRFPKFAEALRHARTAELGPGDALFIPYGWWHHVESLTSFNVLVNYWWSDARQAGSPYDAMLHAMLAFRELPPAQREFWRGMLGHYVFTEPDEALGHLPRNQRGMLGPASAERTQAILGVLARAFSRR